MFVRCDDQRCYFLYQNGTLFTLAKNAFEVQIVILIFLMKPNFVVKIARWVA